MFAYVSTMRMFDGSPLVESFSALAEADLTAFATWAAIGDCVKSRIFSASSTVRPRTRSKIRFTFLTE